ncbi:SGNH/GDSL hydrolase family protein [Sphingomonas sp. GM_Shp_2]|uniref:SGNH/GDSL hydrolase family protein n=1 Tax=Sphingomonas sp. GM_Shp_2 TaxID=2937380 RepID=UPI00226A7EED|nr:SGNH/GDSL hydrolase family protein [Sphingomonas sp. GM_Shp_2]
MRSITAAAMGMIVFATASTNAQQTSSTTTPPQARYVSMGSSYAAGPGVPDAADTDVRCARSTNNYAHQFARKRGLTLVDVSCSGATTNDILAASENAAAQIDAVTADTKLVTVTIGGNDVGFVTLLGSASCRQLQGGKKVLGGKCPAPPEINEDTWRNLSISMKRIADEVRARAPEAKLVFVDYPLVLPQTGRCSATPMTSEEAGSVRAVAERLVAVTAAAARFNNAILVQASTLSIGHDACSLSPWINGFPLPGQRPFVPYHPNVAGMSAVAEALDKAVR